MRFDWHFQLPSDTKKIQINAVGTTFEDALYTYALAQVRLFKILFLKWNDSSGWRFSFSFFFALISIKMSHTMSILVFL